MTAKATSGPVTVRVQRAEFGIDTVLTLAIDNAATVEVNLFAAAFETRIVDETGRSYFVRTIRSTLPARVGPRARVEGRLAFDALPSGIRKATLVFPRVRAGGEAYRLEVVMRF
ncbi:MAG: hypothetical protein FJX78_04040 [Armatimonadetes bacterium]|nr:hypothetical protein [Armatimonadota bacterium]